MPTLNETEDIFKLMHTRFFCCLFLLYFFYGVPLGAEETHNLMSAENLFSYAQQLEKAGDFKRAATEYGRLVAFFYRVPAASFKYKQETFFRYALSLANAGEKEQALRAFSALGAAFPEGDRITPALVRMGQLYEEAGGIEQAKQTYHQLLGRGETAATGARLRLSWLSLQEEKGIEQARQYLEKIEEIHAVVQKPTLYRALDGLDDLPVKNPRVAGLLTAVLPGSGHLYLDRPQDALFAFLSNGLLLAGTVQAFQNDISGLGIALGFVELGWYTGTIFSSVSLAHRHNQQLRAGRLEEIRPLFQTDFGFSGLELNLHY